MAARLVQNSTKCITSVGGVVSSCSTRDVGWQSLSKATVGSTATSNKRESEDGMRLVGFGMSRLKIEGRTALAVCEKCKRKTYLAFGSVALELSEVQARGLLAAEGWVGGKCRRCSRGKKLTALEKREIQTKK
jgi:hypothetical protein